MSVQTIISPRRVQRITGDRTTETKALSPREKQVMYLMARGYSNAAIGEVLWLAEDTVKTHVRRIFGKLDAVDRASAVTEAFHRGILWSVGGRLAVQLPAGEIPVVTVR
ncbi:helix-turn-helix transcriptional regulator [Pseudonocardia sp. NPDC049154]|uniref:response regulator transcription factor n=1 Tax=Pseudonocardia sp. NPDC049154 TaxID=3155501 RepID=UPI00340B8518